MQNIVVKVGNVLIGKGYPIVIQTMCNTPTQDVERSYEQCLSLARSGAQIIRLTTQGLKEVAALKIIRSKLRSNGINTPLVADVHFSSKVALEAAKVVEKVRINPGNFSENHNSAISDFTELIKVCKEYGTAIRIGVNHGSLGTRIIEKYGDTPLGMKEAALEWIKMAEDNNFDQIVISLKSSNTRVMVDAYRLLHKEMLLRGVIYPLHLGVTEAGNGEFGRVKSAVGLSSLLTYGIGDTIRVSLTEPPVNELPVAKFIADYFRSDRLINKILTNFSYKTKTWIDFILLASCEIGPHLLDKEIDDFNITLECQEIFKSEDLDRFKDIILQASRRKFTSPEYIACPGCGRTLFNLETVFEEVKKRTSHLVGYNIAVMGCIVNGPGEMADADYGYVGEGKNRVSIYRGKTPVYRSVPENEAIDVLLELIEMDKQSKNN